MRVQILPKEGYVTNMNILGACALSANCVCDRLAMTSGNSWNTEIFKKEMARRSYEVSC